MAKDENAKKIQPADPTAPAADNGEVEKAVEFERMTSSTWRPATH
jgi:hypothetical protein